MGWVRIKKDAEILRLSPKTVRQGSNEGRIRCYRSAAGQQWKLLHDVTSRVDEKAAPRE